MLEPESTRKRTHHLLRSHADRLYGELATTVVEKVFEVRSEEVDDEDVMESFLPEMVHLWYTDWKRCEPRDAGWTKPRGWTYSSH